MSRGGTLNECGSELGQLCNKEAAEVGKTEEKVPHGFEQSIVAVSGFRMIKLIIGELAMTIGAHRNGERIAALAGEVMRVKAAPVSLTTTGAFRLVGAKALVRALLTCSAIGLRHRSVPFML
jgi:hypothetical protein